MIAKQVIIIRKDLNMRKGKAVAQGAHASLAVILDALRIGKLRMTNPRVLFGGTYGGKLKPELRAESDGMQSWLDERFTKICVYVNSEAELLEVHQKVKEAGLPCSLIQDAGRTEFKEPTYTAVAIGPDWADKIDPITGDLPLL